MYPVFLVVAIAILTGCWVAVRIENARPYLPQMVVRIRRDEITTERQVSVPYLPQPGSGMIVSVTHNGVPERWQCVVTDYEVQFSDAWSKSAPPPVANMKFQHLCDAHGNRIESEPAHV